jgi:hypothetical protein
LRGKQRGLRSTAIILDRKPSYHLFLPGYVNDEDHQSHAEDQSRGLKAVAKYEILVNKYHFMAVLSEMECEM